MRMKKKKKKKKKKKNYCLCKNKQTKQMNVVHTDLKPENIMFSRPSVSVRKAIAKYENLDSSKITEVCVLLSSIRLVVSLMLRRTPASDSDSSNTFTDIKTTQKQSSDDERQVKISDFGLSYLLRPENDIQPSGEKLSASDLQLIYASNYTKVCLYELLLLLLLLLFILYK